MYCTQCGSAVRLGVNFCERCRAPVENTMPGSASAKSIPVNTAKPLGLVLVAVFTGILAVFSILGGAFLMFAAALPQAALQWWDAVFGFALLLLGVLACAATYGLWVRVPWGYSLTRFVYIISILLGLVDLFTDKTMGNVVLTLIYTAPDVWVLVYLTKPEIRGVFRSS